MKKVILVISTFIISFGAFAQTDSLNRKMSPTDTREQENTDRNKSYNSGEQRSQDTNLTSKPSSSHPDGYMMENGRMTQYKAGKSTMMESSGTLSNGTKIMSDGTYLTSDGRKMMLQNGEHLGMDGKIVPMSSRSGSNTGTKNDMQRDRSTMPDSTEKKSTIPR